LRPSNPTWIYFAGGSPGHEYMARPPIKDLFRRRLTVP
jgi:hypothetical protein